MKAAKDVSEVTNQIYDTLMGNVGMSQYHTPFPLEKVGFCEVEARIGYIHFQLGALEYEVKVTAKNLKINRGD